MSTSLKKRRMRAKRPPLAAYVVKPSPRWPSEGNAKPILAQMGLVEGVSSKVMSFLGDGHTVDWLGIGWPLHPSHDKAALTTNGWIQHVLLFNTSVALERNGQTKKMIRAIRDASQYWAGQFFNQHRPIKCFTEACGVLLAVAYNGLPFESRPAFMHGSFHELIYYSEYNDPSHGSGEFAWRKTCMFVHRTWRDILHVAFCVLMHRAVHRRTQQALRDCAHFYDHAVRICQEGEARPFRFYWRAFETLRTQSQTAQESTTKLRLLVDLFARKEGGRSHGLNRMPLYWQHSKFREPSVSKSGSIVEPR